jgi:acyl carrier protein
VKTIEDRLKAICEDQLGTSPKDISDSSRFVEDIGMDSLDTVEVVMAVEEEFNLEISDEDAEKCLTFGDAMTYIKEHVRP